jgi:hypothetical protein
MDLSSSEPNERIDRRVGGLADRPSQGFILPLAAIQSRSWVDVQKLALGTCYGMWEGGGEFSVRVVCDLSLHVMVSFQNICFQQMHVSWMWSSSPK